MSGSRSPPRDKAKVPLPPVLPTKIERTYSNVDNLRPSFGHKKTISFDNNIYSDSDLSSPYTLEDRSPQGYSSGSRSPASSTYPRDDRDAYITVNKTKSRRDDSRYVKERRRSPIEGDDSSGPSSKLKSAIKSSQALHKTLGEENKTAKINYAAAVSLSREVEELKAQVEAMRVSEEINKIRVVEAERQLSRERKERKLRELDEEIRVLKDKQRSRDTSRESRKSLEQKQWDDIINSPIRPTARPLVLTQEPSGSKRTSADTAALYKFNADVVEAKPPRLSAGQQLIREAQEERDREELERMNREYFAEKQSALKQTARSSRRDRKDNERMR